MGPIIGMTPEKRAETPGAEKFAGLSQIYKMGSLPEAVDAARPKATLVDSEPADDELTNLNWLHESTNLLTNFSFGSEGLPIVSPLYDIEGDDVPSLGPSCYQNPEKISATSKPPYSFSLLIYMAIEHSTNKCLPVKEIYSWILDRFPYFATAPTGWKNSVRNNLSLNKCFQKVERSHGKVSVYEYCYIWGSRGELINMETLKYGEIKGRNSQVRLFQLERNYIYLLSFEMFLNF